jgi:hypothetical protein
VRSTRIRIHAVAVLLCAFAVPAAAADEDTTQCGFVPPEAFECAQRYLEESWKPHAKREPAFFWIESLDVDIDQATLGRPFVEYTLSGERGVEYARSAGRVDPCGFATSVGYAFPVQAGAEYLGSMVVSPNRDANGRPLLEKEGDYVIGELVPRGDGVCAMAVKLGERYPYEDGYRISWVHVTVLGGETFFVIAAPDTSWTYEDTTVPPPEGDAKADTTRRGVISH